MRTETTKVLRSRLLAAAGVSALAFSTACGSTTTSQSDAGHGGGAGGSSSTGGAAGASATGGASTGGSSNPDAGMGGSSGAAGAGTGGQWCTPWPQCATVRRPFLVGADLRSSRVETRSDWSGAASDVSLPHARTAEFLAQSWLRDALEEHASVAAFARFTLLLLSAGAPPELIAASQRAALDEIQHARACFALARRYGAGDVGPSPLDVADSLTAMSLSEIVALAVAEGCVGETLGALLATEQLDRATDPEVRKVLVRIARDEARHAELAWKFLAWALREGDASVHLAAQHAFAAAAEEIRCMPVVDYGVDVDLWHAHGRVTCAEAREVSLAGLREIVEPCLQALTGTIAPRESRSSEPAMALSPAS